MSRWIFKYILYSQDLTEMCILPKGPSSQYGSILCTGEIVTGRTDASTGYINYNLGEGGLGFLTL
jgi:hypothetical protein